MKNRFERGAIVQYHDRSWIVWSYPPRVKLGDPICLPVVALNRPQHRSHVRLAAAALGLQQQAMVVVIKTNEAEALPRNDCVQTGQCSDQIVSLIATAIVRDHEARSIEQQRSM